MKGWNKIVVVFAVLLAAFLCKNLFAGQGDAEKLSKTVSIEKSVTMGCIEARNPTNNPEQVSVDKLTKEALIPKTRTLPMPFIANNGQVDEQVRFYAKTFGGTVFVTKEGEIVYALPEGRGRDVPAGASQEAGRGMRRGGSGAEGQWSGGAGALRSSGAAGWHGQEPLAHADAECVATNVYLPLFRTNNTNCPPGRVLANTLISAYLPGLQKETTQRVVSTPATSNPGNNNPHSKIPNPQSPLRGVAIKEHLVGGKIGGIAGKQPAVTTVNYFTGNDKAKWKTNVPTYNMVNLGEVYQGIELSLKAYGDNVEKLFCVKPGASPECIKVQLDGSKSLRINQEGQLEVETELGLVKFTRPIAYQAIAGKLVEVAVEYSIHSAGIYEMEDRGAGEQGGRGEPEILNSKLEIPNSKPIYGFTVASYDKTKDLIIDPLLASTFLGGYYEELCRSLALDTSGNVYVTGETYSSDFPTTSGAYDTSIDNYYDAFVSKLNSGLTSLLASTFLGGSDDDWGSSLTLDTSGNVYMTGGTYSPDFPTTSGAYDTSYNNAGDVFVSKLDSGLTSLLASTFLGRSFNEEGRSLTLDTSGNVYVTGWTWSTNFPTTSGAYDTSYNNAGDVFVSKLNSGLTSLLASTFLGGSDADGGFSLALDTSGNVYVTGFTTSSSFPTTSGAYDTSYNGGAFYGDGFVSKLDGNLSATVECAADSITASHNKLTLGKGKNGDVTITVTGAGECPVEGIAVTATINGKGKRLIDISPGSQETNANGQAVFAINAKDKKGTAILKFKADGLDDLATVQVKVR